MTTAKGTKNSKADERDQRLAAQLRANLKKRKSQARQRQAAVTGDTASVNKSDSDI